MHTNRLPISKDIYLMWGQKLQWATQEHYKMLLGTYPGRDRRTEQMCPRLEERGKYVSTRWGKKKAYAVRRMKNAPLEHGLGCTETLIRTWLSDKGGIIIQEREFRGLGSVADWGIRYNDKESLLLCEFSTENNFNGARIIKTKITKYVQNLEKIRERFKVPEIGILFVIDVPRDRIFYFTKQYVPPKEFYFIDYETFKNVPLGQQLKAKIYFWLDGQVISIRE